MDKNFLIFSDLHLENRGQIKPKFLMDIINEKHKESENNNKEQIVLFAGDIHNGTKGYDWLSQCESKSYYIAGNHEFWGNDYYETIQNLKKEQPKNINFLHNEIRVVDEKTIILGATMWTDVGLSLNPSVFKHAGFRMNDNHSITAKDWYKNPENVQKLTDFMGSDRVKSYLNNQYWNPLIEVEENNKTIAFINQFNDVLSLYLALYEVCEKLNTGYIKEEQVKSISKSFQIIIKTDDINEYKKEINKIKEFFSYIFLNDDELSDVFSKESFELFKVLRNIKDVKNMKVIVLTHHLPFLEEILIGRFGYNYDNYNLINEVEDSMFIVKHGKDYPIPNYLYRCSKGDLDRSSDITHFVNYYNNGDVRINKSFLNRVNVWVHGHEHTFNYKDYLKNILMVTNTGAGVFFNAIDVNQENAIEYNKNFKMYSSANSEDLKTILIKNTFKDFNVNSSLNNKESKVFLWCWNNFNKEKLEENILSINTLSNDLMKFELGNKTNSKLQEKLKNGTIALYKEEWSNLNDLLNNFLISMEVRLDSNFNMNNYIYKKLKKNELIYNKDSKKYIKYLCGTNLFLELSNFMFDMNGNINIQNSFEINELSKLMLKHIKKSKELIKLNTNDSSVDISLANLELFNGVSSKLIEDNIIYDKLLKKWEVFKTKKETLKSTNTYRVSGLGSRYGF